MPLEKVSEQVRGKKDHLSDDLTEGSEPGTTDRMPVVPHKVIYAGIPFFSDPQCEKRVEDANILLLQPLDPDGFQMIDVVPTRKNYKPGQYLNWQLNNKSIWEQSYYHNPESGQIEPAWTMHVEFVGKVISEAALAKDKKRMDELEARYAQPQGTVN